MIRSAIQERARSEARWERWLGRTTLGVLRIVSLAYLALTLLIWARTVGHFPADQADFAAMSVPMRIYSATLCVLFPIVAVGLWTTLSWGRVVWFIAVAVQLAAFVFFPDVIAVDRTLLAIHALALSLYFALEIVTRIVTNED